MIIFKLMPIIQSSKIHVHQNTYHNHHMQPPPPPLSCSIRAPKPAKATDPHLYINRKSSVIKRVDYRSEITTSIFKTSTWVSNYPWELMKLQAGPHTGHKHIHTYHKAGQCMIETYLTYSHNFIHPNIRHTPVPVLGGQRNS